MSKLSRPFQLQPLTATQLLDRTVWLYRRHFWTFLGITAFIQLPILILGYVSNFMGLGVNSVDSLIMGNVLSSLGSGGIVQIAFSPFILLFLNGAFQIVVTQIYLGEEVSVFGTYRRLLKRFWALSLTLVALLITSIVTVLWFLIPILGTLSWPGMIAFFSAVIVPISICVTVAERVSAFEAVDRAWQLTRKRFWQSLGFSILLGLFTTFAFIGPSALVGASILTSNELQNGSIAYWVLIGITTFLSIILRLFVAPISAVAMGLFYFDLRVRLEGIDLIKRIDDGLVDEKFLVEAPRMVRPKRILTIPETLRFAAILFTLVGIYAAIFGIFLILAFAFSI